MSDISASIDPDQYGNLRGSSTSHYLVKLLDFVLKGLDQPKTFALITLIDFRKAFDLVDHSIAVRELFTMGCRPELIPVISSFLQDRQHRVSYGEALSNWANITCGVPQGTLLGPIIFLCVVNSVARNAPLHVKYVDDLSLAEIVDASDDVIHLSTQGDLTEVSNDCIRVLITTNPLKCEVLICRPPAREITLPDLTIDDVILPLVSEVKLLGIYLNSELNWTTHVTHLIKKVNKCLFILYRAKQFRFNIRTLFTLYVWYIRTSLEYGVPVWHSSLTRKQSDQLERVQRRCFRIILGSAYLGYDEACERLGTTSLEKRRTQLCYRFAKGILKSEKHRAMLPAPFQHRYTTRGRERLLPSVRCRQARYYKSSVPYLVRLLNGEN